MIRRAFWLGVGAALGITGYRRLMRLARVIAPRAAAVQAPLRPGEITTGTSSFVRDVRAGMAEYLDARGEYMSRRSARPGNNLVVRARASLRAPASDNPKDGR